MTCLVAILSQYSCNFFIMKTAKLIIPFLLFTTIVKAQVPTTEFFEHFTLKTDASAAPAGYGLTPQKPIPVGAYVEDLTDQKKITAQLNRFFKTLLWADGAPLRLLSRSSSMVDGVNIDKFVVTKPAGKDTVTLYTDLYNAAPIQAPQGFKFYTREQMAAELAPILTQLKAYNAMPDKLGDEKAKQASMQLLGYLQADIGIDYLLDKDEVGALLDDTGIDMDFKAFLIRSYLFHKFEYDATGQADVKTKAFNAVVDDYQQAIARHDVFAKGSLATLMVKK